MKRRSIIAALCASAGVLQKAFAESILTTSALTFGYAPVIWEIRGTQDDHSKPIPTPPCEADTGTVCITNYSYEQKPVEFALIVRYDGREVKLTPSEIMDALEGK